MALEEIRFIDKLEVSSSGTVYVREKVEIRKDGTLISSTYNRTSISIELPDPDLSWMDDASRAVVEAARTPERLAAAAEQTDDVL